MFWKKPTGGKVSYGNSREVADEYNVGVRCLQAGNVGKAIEIFSGLQARDHPSATFNLALLYAQGHGSRFMFPECFELFKKAARLGHDGATAYAANFMRFASGFGPTAPAMHLAEIAGNDICPALVAGTLAADVICNVPGEVAHLSYVGHEIVALYSGDETSQIFTGKNGEREFLRFLELEVEDARDVVDFDAGSSLEDYTPKERSWNVGVFLEECVSDNGMSPNVAIYIRVRPESSCSDQAP
jgi:hypothetical protein